MNRSIRVFAIVLLLINGFICDYQNHHKRKNRFHRLQNKLNIKVFSEIRNNFLSSFMSITPKKIASKAKTETSMVGKNGENF